jgi:hypothetical protein
MTRDEILKLSKKELNEAVAQNVMGWHIIHAKRNYMTCPGHIYPLEGDWWATESGEVPYLVEDWNPAEKIEDAWRVVEHLGNLRGIGKVDTRGMGLSLYGIDDDWICAFLIPPNEEVEARGKTAQMVICRAALMVVEGV